MPDKKHQTPWGLLLMLFVPPLNLLGVPILALRFAFRDFKTLRRGIDEEARRFGRQQVTLLTLAACLLLVEMAVIGSSMRAQAQSSRRELLVGRAQRVCLQLQKSQWCARGQGEIPSRFRPDPAFPFEETLSYRLEQNGGQAPVLFISSDQEQVLADPVRVECPCTSP